MEKNMSMGDRGIRNIFAVIVVVLFYMEIISGTLLIVLGATAFYFALTSMVAFCPIYYLFKINTIKK